MSLDWDYRLNVVGPGEFAGETDELGPVRPANDGYPGYSAKLDPGDRDDIQSVVLNRLYKLDQIGPYRVVLRRRVWKINPAYVSLSVKAFLDQAMIWPCARRKQNPYQLRYPST